MNIVAIIQARMSSTRLPGKVLRVIGTEAMLDLVVKRARRASLVTQVVVATTTEAEDDVLASYCKSSGVPYFQGSLLDVLDRYYEAAKEFKADAIVRITSDCPLIDGGIVDKVVQAFIEGKPDYASNSLTRTYPRGLDTEVFTWHALEKAWLEARKSYQREHVTPYIYENPSLFKLLPVSAEKDYSQYRWTVDTPEDLDFMRAVSEKLNLAEATWEQVLRLLEQEPALAMINSHIEQKKLVAE